MYSCFRWHCKACGYLSVNRNALMQHFGKRHNGECLELSPPLSPDNAIEDWVCLSRFVIFRIKL